MKTRNQIIVGFLMAIAATFIAVAGAYAQSGAYGSSNANRYSASAHSGSVSFYRQSSPTRSNAGGSSYSTSVYGGNRAPSYSNGGLTGGATYSGAGSSYNEQSMNYFSASSQGPKLRVHEVSHPSRHQDYTRYWSPKREDGYYKVYWRGQ